MISSRFGEIGEKNCLVFEIFRWRILNNSLQIRKIEKKIVVRYQLYWLFCFVEFYECWVPGIPLHDSGSVSARDLKKLLELIIAKKMKRENFVNIIKTSLLLFVFLLKGKNYPRPSCQLFYLREKIRGEVRSTPTNNSFRRNRRNGRIVIRILKRFSTRINMILW